MNDNMEVKNNKSKWYIVQVLPNKEMLVRDTLQNDSDASHNDENVDEVYLPLKTVETKTKKILIKPLFPGYIFIRAVMSDDLWYLVRNTLYVTGIVGSSGQRTVPTPISNFQIENIISKVKEQNNNFHSVNSEKAGYINTKYSIGDAIEIIDGDFKGKKAKIVSLSSMLLTAKIDIELFGRTVEINISLENIKKS